MPVALKMQGVKVNKIVSKAAGDLYISPKYRPILYENEFYEWLILHFREKKHII